MAKETKVGLLAGLAFIICFAVILANRGRQEAVTQRLALPAEQAPSIGAAHRAARPGPVSGSDASTARLPAGVESPADPVPATRQEFRRGTPGRPEGTPAAQPAGGPLPGSPVLDDPRFVRSASPSADQAMAERVRLLEQRLAQLTEGTPDGSATRTAGTAPGQTDFSAPLTAQSGRDVSRPSLDPARDVASQAGTSERLPAMPVKGRRHTIAAGDSLYRIADRYYGGKSATYIRAIFDANRRVLTDPDRLPIGVELVVPDLPEKGVLQAGATHAQEASKTANPRDAARTPLASESAVPFRWYQIKRNDRYVSIAREQLGNEHRWKEIYELNKDKFPNASQIREGVRIKLPAAEMADARGGRR